MTSLMLLGFLIGMRHAIEADHVAAVASLVSRTESSTQAVSQGVLWGIGHTLMLFAFAGAVLVFGVGIPEMLAQLLEFVVGAMLVLLGMDVLWRIYRDKIHFHVHQHGDGVRHVHTHSHARDASGQHDPSQHHHSHRKPFFTARALWVGSMHGMAGSAALMLLTLGTVNTPLTGLFYVLLFGVGSILGMAALSLVIAIPLSYSAAKAGGLHRGLHLLTGVATTSLGFFTMYQFGL